MAKDRYKKRKQNRKRIAEQEKRDKWSDSESEEETAISQRKKKQNRKRKVEESKVMQPESKKVKNIESKTKGTTMVAIVDEAKKEEEGVENQIS